MLFQEVDTGLLQGVKTTATQTICDDSQLEAQQEQIAVGLPQTSEWIKVIILLANSGAISHLCTSNPAVSQLAIDNSQRKGNACSGGQGDL